MRIFVNAVVFSLVIHGLYMVGSYVYDKYTDFTIERELQQANEQELRIYNEESGHAVGMVTWTIPGPEPDTSFFLLTVPAFIFGYVFVKKLR